VKKEKNRGGFELNFEHRKHNTILKVAVHNYASSESRIRNYACWDCRIRNVKKIKAKLKKKHCKRGGGGSLNAEEEEEEEEEKYISCCDVRRLFKERLLLKRVRSNWEKTFWGF
jgi:hypothetical protein